MVTSSNQEVNSDVQTHSQSQSQLVMQSFSNLVSIKLDEENYLAWKQQAKATIIDYDLEAYLDQNQIPEKFELEEDANLGKVSQEFRHWEKQDKLVMSWLLALMTAPFTTRMVGCKASYQIWQHVDEYFASYTRARIK